MRGKPRSGGKGTAFPLRIECHAPGIAARIRLWKTVGEMRMSSTRRREVDGRLASPSTRARSRYGAAVSAPARGTAEACLKFGDALLQLLVLLARLDRHRLHR